MNDVMKMTFGADRLADLFTAAKATGQVYPHEARIVKGETAWMPGTTKHVWRGPKVIRYEVYPDGGCNSQVVK